MAFSVKSILPTHIPKPDFNGDGYTDIIWHGADGSLVIWNMDASGRYGAQGTFIPNPDPGGNTLSLKGYGNANGDATTDMVWQDLAGRIQVWGFQGNQHGVTQLTNYGMNYQTRALGDFNGDGRDDLLWFVPPAPVLGGADGVWVTGIADNRPIPASALGPLAPISIDFQFVGVGDFNGDGRDDLLFRGTGNATVGTFLIDQPTGVITPSQTYMASELRTFRDPGQDWAVLGLADFDGDGKTDYLWQHTNAAGQVDARTMWLANGGGGMLYDPGPEWKAVDIADYNNDGKADVMWKHTSGWYAELLMNGAEVAGIGASFVQTTDFWTIGGV